MPASEIDLKLASLLYFQIFGVDFPEQNYNQQDIEYIISELISHPEINVFNSSVLH
jgi:hypothetical protein